MKLQHCCWWTGRKKAAMAGASAANAEPVLPGCALIRKVFLVSPRTGVKKTICEPRHHAGPASGDRKCYDNTREAGNVPGEKRG